MKDGNSFEVFQKVRWLAVLIGITAMMQPTETLGQDFVVGTKDTHKKLWEERKAKEALEEKLTDLRIQYTDELERIPRIIEANTEKIESLQSGYYIPIKRGEFETTDEFNKRKELLLKSLELDLKKENRKLETRIIELRNLVKDSASKPIDASLVIQVEMAKYDAEKNQIPSFYYSEEKQFIDQNNDLCVYQILKRPIRSINVDRELGKKIRSASDEGLLYAYVESIHLYTSYYDHANRPKDPEKLALERKRAEQVELIGAGISLLLGVDGQMAPTPVDSMIEVPAKRITISWNLDRSPIELTSLHRYDRDTGNYTKLWPERNVDAGLERHKDSSAATGKKPVASEDSSSENLSQIVLANGVLLKNADFKEVDGGNLVFMANGERVSVPLDQIPLSALNEEILTALAKEKNCRPPIPLLTPTDR